MPYTRRAQSHSRAVIGNTAAYPNPESPQSAGFWHRLSRRKITPRLVLAYAAATVILLFAQPTPTSFAVGTALVLTGLTLRIWTFGHLRKNQTLATTGPYAHTRNPAYLGSLLIMTGLFLAAGNAHTIAGIALWGAGIAGIVYFFAAYLPRKFHNEYGQLQQLFPVTIQRHAAHVPDFFPRLSPWRSGDRRRFSWHCVMANHEPIWPVACVMALALIWFG